MTITFESKVKSFLKKKDGFTHVIIFNVSDYSNIGRFECDSSFTYELDGVIVDMQKLGYEIIDIKIDKNKKRFDGSEEYYNVLIIYK